MSTFVVALLALSQSTLSWAQGSGGGHGASAPIPAPGMDAVTKRIIGGGELQPGRRAPRRSSIRLPGPSVIEIDASEPWPGGPRPSDSGLKRILEGIGDVNARHATGLLIPPRVQMRLFTLTGLEGEWLADTGYGIPPTRFDVTADQLFIGEALGSSLGAPQSPGLSLAIALHEYGHVLFLENLERRIPAVRGLRQLLRRSGDLKRLRDEAGMKVRAGLSCQLDPGQLEWLLNNTAPRDEELRRERCEVWTDLKTRFDALQREIEADPIRKRINAYAELYADLVAIVQTGELDAIERALLLPGLREIPEFNQRARLRSFASCPTPGEARVDPKDPEDHGYFAPARCELGQQLRGGSQQVLSRVLGVLAADLVQSVELDRPRDPKMDNERLIERLRKEFR